MTKAQKLAQKLVDDIQIELMDMPMTDVVINDLSLTLARKTLATLYDENTKSSKNDFYCKVNDYLNETDIEF